jgi:hypothetical protein
MFPELITELLHDGYKVNFSAPGHSMFPTIMANETIMVEPIDPETVRLADIILYRTNGQLIAHRVINIEKKINDAISVSQSSKNAQSILFMKGDSPPLKRSAPQAKRSSSEALHHRSAPQVKRSSNEVLHHRSAPQAKHSSPETTAGSSTSEALQFLFRGDASRACDEPVKAGQILGKVISIERCGCSIDPYSSTHKLCCYALYWMARVKRLPRIIFSIFSSNGREDAQIGK